MEIQDAVISRERLVLVVGPNAALSDYVWGEWQFGLAACRIRESNTTSTRPYRRSAQAILSFGYLLRMQDVIQPTEQVFDPKGLLFRISASGAEMKR